MFEFLRKYFDQIIGMLMFFIGWLLLAASMWDIWRIWTFFQILAWPEFIMHVVCACVIWVWGYKVFFHKND